MHPPGASELCKEWMERVTGTAKGDAGRYIVARDNQGGTGG